MTSLASTGLPGRASWRSPAFPLALGAAIAPVAAVLQSKAMAPIALACLLLSVLAARREQGRWPLPAGLPFWIALALALWGGLSALWAVEPRQSLAAAAQFGGIALLAAAAARGVEGEDARPLALCLFWGVLAGLALATIDNLTGNAVRMGVRGLHVWRPEITFGLKPAASVMALLLPLLPAAPLPRALRIGGTLLGAIALLALPGDTARIAGLVGLAVAACFAWMPARPGRTLAAAGVAAVVLLAPMATALLARPEVAAHLPLSAVHRVLIWDFARSRAAERPWLGWGMESSRAIPGGRDNFPTENLARLGMTGPEARAFFDRPGVEALPLHPHNAPLQLRLELGWPGLLLCAGIWAALAFRAPGPLALGVLASALVTFLFSYGAWQPWWVASQALAVAMVSALGPAPVPGKARP
ncbi:O-antigen polymerase [Roseomonas mucosa]|uniref:O-antigen ligase family protein n=1 Tax=Roseomonas mucosa TaxID=207340 RepID=UPI00220B2C29|nr:O-antigen ligase family protein [Roseomonas mucosa]QDJ10364.1 O-antigen polymerase [Roseomonas mucosa]